MNDESTATANDDALGTVIELFLARSRPGEKPFVTDLIWTRRCCSRMENSWEPSRTRYSEGTVGTG